VPEAEGMSQKRIIIHKESNKYRKNCYFCSQTPEQDCAKLPNIECEFVNYCMEGNYRRGAVDALLERKYAGSGDNY
jgi:hypothetical protein